MFTHSFNQPKVYAEIVQYIIENYNDFIGCTLRPTFLQQITAWRINKRGSSFDETDVLVAMRAMVEEGQLVRSGTWGKFPTYTVRKDLRKPRITL